MPLHPPVLQFSGPGRKTNFLPPQYAALRIPAASETRCLEGSFGCYLSQVIQSADWSVGWLHFFIRETVTLLPTTSFPMAMLYSSIEGTVRTRAQRTPGQLDLEHRKTGCYYLPSRMRHQSIFEPGKYESVYVSFSRQFLHRMAAQHPQFEKLSGHMIRQSPKADQLQVFNLPHGSLLKLEEIKNSKLEGPASQLFIHARINELLLHYFELLEPAVAEAPAYESSIREAAAYIQEHYIRDLPVTMLARKAGMNTNTFIIRFKQVTGATPAEFVQQTRVKVAENLLSHGELSVDEISAQSGFASRTYFSRVFKKHYNLSPVQYKNRWKNA